MLPEIDPSLAPAINGLAIALAAVWMARKYIRAFFSEPVEQPLKSSDPAIQVVGGALADRAAIMELVRALDRMSDAIEGHSHLITQRDREKDQRSEMADLRREIERLRRLPRGND